MALPSSGQLALSQISDEFGGGSRTNVSLRALSSAAGLTAPDGVSEFYGLSNNPAAAHFHTAKVTGNGGTSSISMPFTPEFAWAAEDERNINTFRVFVNGFAELGLRPPHRPMSQSPSSFVANGFNLGYDANKLNTSGTSNYLMFFNFPTTVTTPISGNALPNPTYRVNTTAGFGLVSWSGKLQSSNIYLQGLNQKSEFAFSWSDDATASFWFNGSSSLVLGNSTLENDGDDYYYTDNAMWLRYVQSGRDQLYNYRNPDKKSYFFDYFAGSDYEASSIFYAHAVAGISVVGSIYPSPTATVTTGWRPRMVIAFEYRTGGGVFYHIDGMPSNTSYYYKVGTYDYRVNNFGITLSSTGFSLRAVSSGSEVRYYAIR